MEKVSTAKQGANKRRGCSGWKGLLLVVFALGCSSLLSGRQRATQPLKPVTKRSVFHGQTTRDYNRRLGELLQRATAFQAHSPREDYRIGPEDLLQISVFGAPDLDSRVRVSADGNIAVPLLGNVRAAGLSTGELGTLLERLLRGTYMKNPHVNVFVKQMESHPVAVFGSVEKPGVYQIRGPENLIEVLARAQGLAADAGDSVIVMRGGGGETTGTSGGQAVAPSATARTARRTVRINLKELLDSGAPRYNVAIDPGDVVTVTRAGIVYVVGEVRKPGGFLLKTNEDISVLQALALAEGLTHTSAARHAHIIRTDRASGKRTEIPINLKKILTGQSPDPLLHSRDILFVPNSTGRAAFYRGIESALSVAGGVIVYRR